MQSNIIQISSNVYAMSVRAVGEKLYKIKDEDIAEQIASDIQGTFSDEVLEVDVGLDVEDIEDFRSFKQCVLFECEVIIRFSPDADEREITIKTIQAYLNEAYVKPFK